MSTTEAAAKGRVLLVDDDPSVLRSMERPLTRAGYEVPTAPDGLVGILRARAGARSRTCRSSIWPAASRTPASPRSPSTAALFDGQGRAAGVFYGAPPDLHADVEARISALLARPR
jgi:CheY-like chemotaxis protein